MTDEDKKLVAELSSLTPAVHARILKITEGADAQVAAANARAARLALGLVSIQNSPHDAPVARLREIARNCLESNPP